MKQRDFIREAGADCSSLLTEGYIMRVHCYNPSKKVAYSSLKHKENGNKITIYATSDGYIMRKNGKLIKMVK